jgi:hypothetical protein
MTQHDSAGTAPAIGLQVYDGAGRVIELRPDEMSPEVFKARIEREQQMREILQNYVRSNMKEDHHYSRKLGTVELVKPMLLKEGVQNICSLFKLYFGNPETTETRDGDHYRVRTHIALYNAEGRQIASGDAVCSTMETKYAFRKGERECPSCGKATVRKSKYPPRNEPNGQPGWYCSDKDGGCGAQFAANDVNISQQVTGRVDNPDKADVENTVLKMSIKRAKTAAVCDVPMVSEIFAPEHEDLPGGERSAVSGQQSAKNSNSTPRRPSAEQSSVASTAPTDDDAEEASAILGEVRELLLAKCGDGVNVDEERAAAVLKGRDLSQMTFGALAKLRNELRELRTEN